MGLISVIKSMELEEKIRKKAIENLFPDDYMKHRDLITPLKCSILINLFEKNTKYCADRYGYDGYCDALRKSFISCEAIRREVEKLKNPDIILAEEEVERYKRAVIAKAEAEGEL